MAKIALTNIYLVNWYGFINTKIPIGKDLSLITGENECGKSTILDAVKYAFIGDAEFNKSSSVHNIGGSRRTLHSYTRCLVDASAGIFARPADKMPNVHSHISLEYYDEVNGNFFVLGTILETNVSNNVSTYWYAIDHMNMEEIQYVYKDGTQIKPYDYQGFQKKYGIPLMAKKDALIKFMNMTGLKLAYTEIGGFQRKLRNIMTYNPAAKIQQFIKESVLEAHDVNFDKLRDAKSNIEKINGTLALIKAEVDALDAILKDFAEHERVTARIFIDDVKQVYKEILKRKKSIDTAQLNMEKNKVEIQRLETVIEEMDKEKERKETDFLAARSNLNQLDCAKAIEEEKKEQQRLEQQRNQLEQAKVELCGFQDDVNELLHLMRTLDAEVSESDVLQLLVSKEYSYVEKQNAVNNLKKNLFQQKDRLVEIGAKIKGDLGKLQEELNHCHAIIENCEKNKPDYSAVNEQLSLIREINKEFQNRNINAKAMFSCEYVIKIKDEEWRSAIESFLGIHRYSVIVDPAYFDIANAVLDRSAYKYVELVNTKLLAAKKITCHEDSVVHKLVIKNDIAQKYFDYWLGNIHAVEMREVPRYENAISKEGKLSRNMAVTFINMRKIRTFCLGQEAIELNRQSVQKRLAGLEGQEKEILMAKAKNEAQGQQIRAKLECFKEYHFDAYAEYEAVSGKWNESKEKLKRLLEAQKNNKEYQALLALVWSLEAELIKLREGIDQRKDRKRDLEVENKNSQGNLRRDESILQEREEKLKGQKLFHATEAGVAIKEYDDFVAGISKTGDIMLPDSRRRRDNEKGSLEAAIVGGQKVYNNKKKQEEELPEGLQYEGRYLARKNKIWVDDLQEINLKMAEQTRKYESIFKNEFVLSLYQTALSAKEDIAGINKELRKLQFATRYQFDVNLLNDKSDYAKILRYAEYLKKTNKVDDGQMVFGYLYGYEDDELELREKEIKEIINRIIDKNDMGVIHSFADYRNYMSYEILINNADVKDGRLSKQAGYNSGAGTQIPYTLILSAALSMLYNARINATRLIFIDEPFEKMSDHNIKLMLDFFKNQDFQVIFCAPPNKTDSIGYECDTIIPVLKIKNDNMQIGSVQFHDRNS